MLRPSGEDYGLRIMDYAHNLPILRALPRGLVSPQRFLSVATLPVGVLIFVELQGDWRCAIRPAHKPSRSLKLLIRDVKGQQLGWQTTKVAPRCAADSTVDLIVVANGNTPPDAPTKQPKTAEGMPAPAPAPSTTAFASSGAALDEKAVGKAVRAVLRSHPELKQASRKELRERLEKKLGDLSAWKETIKAAAADVLWKEQN